MIICGIIHHLLVFKTVYLKYLFSLNGNSTKIHCLLQFNVVKEKPESANFPFYKKKKFPLSLQSIFLLLENTFLK